jgi:uncharacterized protein YndB with AHSA1/START domain
MVRIFLTPCDKGTVLTLSQVIVERLPGEASFADFWALSLENLRRLLLNTSGPLFCDFSAAHRGQAVVTAHINRLTSEVFSGLIDPQQLERYIADKATVEPRVGGKYDFGWEEGGPIKILELEPNRKLTYSLAEPPLGRRTVLERNRVVLQVCQRLSHGRFGSLAISLHLTQQHCSLNCGYTEISHLFFPGIWGE